MKLFAISADLIKYTDLAVTTKMVLGYRLKASKEEALGAFILSVKEDYPTFSVRETLIVEIPTSEAGEVIEE